MTDTFDGHATSLISPAAGAFAITPSDTENLSRSGRALYIGSAGHVTLVTVSGQTVRFANAGDGSILPVRAQRVLATGTTARDIVGLY